jgi:hypothetical protein
VISPGSLIGAGDVSWPVLDGTALPGLSGEIVAAIEPHTEADPVGILVSLLVAVGAAIGVGPHVPVGGAVHHARIFTVLVGDSAKARKGQAWADAARVLRQMDPEWFQASLMGGFGSGEGLIHQLASDPDEPGRTGLVVDDEFARTLAAAARHGSTLSMVLRQAWDHGNLQALTLRPQHAHDAHLCVVAHITAPELARRLTATDVLNGFANRFLWVLVRRSKLLPSGGHLDDDTVADLGDELRRRVDAARFITTMRRSPAAEETWHALYEELTNDDPPGDLGAVLARAEAQTLRLSMLYALLDASPTIEERHVQAAAALWAYSRASSATLFNTGPDGLAKRLHSALGAAGQLGLTRAELHRAVGNHASRRELDRACAELVEHGIADECTVPTAGRPRRMLSLKKFSPANEAKEADEATRPATVPAGASFAASLSSPVSPRRGSPAAPSGTNGAVPRNSDEPTVSTQDEASEADRAFDLIHARVADIAAGRERPSESPKRIERRSLVNADPGSRRRRHELEGP